MATSDKTLDLIETLRSQGKSFCVATILRTADSTSARAGAKAVVTTDGVIHGFVGGSCVTAAVRRTALECISSGEPGMIRIKPGDEVVTPVDVDGVRLHKSSCPSGGSVELFLEPMRSPRTLVICGASPIAQAIIGFGHALGYRVVVAASADDHRQMPNADLYIDGFGFDDLGLTASDAAIVATQGKRDRDALRAVLLSAAGYKGMVTSRKKIARLKQDLISEKNVPAASFDDLHAPAGLLIGAIEPEEIALSLVSEIVMRLREAKIGREPEKLEANSSR